MRIVLTREQDFLNWHDFKWHSQYSSSDNKPQISLGMRKTGIVVFQLRGMLRYAYYSEINIFKI